MDMYNNVTNLSTSAFTVTLFLSQADTHHFMNMHKLPYKIVPFQLYNMSVHCSVIVSHFCVPIMRFNARAYMYVCLQFCNIELWKEADFQKEADSLPRSLAIRSDIEDMSLQPE